MNSTCLSYFGEKIRLTIGTDTMLGLSELGASPPVSRGVLSVVLRRHMLPWDSVPV